MYNRSYGQRRPPRIPQNYAGNAFSPQGSVQIPQAPVHMPEEDTADLTTAENEVPQGGIFALPAPSAHTQDETPENCGNPPHEEGEKPKPAPHPLLQKGLGDEELLILGLILLLSQGGGSCNAGEVIPFLVLLLFC